MAMTLRVLGGLANPNIGVVQTWIGELVKAETFQGKSSWNGATPHFGSKIYSTSLFVRASHTELRASLITRCDGSTLSIVT